MPPASFAPFASPSTARKTARVRPFADRDMRQVVDLHQKVFPQERPRSLEDYGDYFSRVFLRNPAGRGPLPSLVHEEDDGCITGFLGLVPRRVVAGGCAFQAMVSSQFIVDPASAVGLVAMRLAKAYLEGPQDLSIADEANDISRRIWEGLGGTTALLYSIYWTRPLRPFGLGLSYLRGRRGFAGVVAAARPAASVADFLATRMPGSHVRKSPATCSADELRVEALLEHASDFCDQTSLRVDYDERTLQWLLDRAGGSGRGRLLTAAVRNRSTLVGWYVSYLDRHGVADVAQLAATPSSIHEVLDHLFDRARRQGAIAVTGRMDPRFMDALSDKLCLFHRRGPWVLIKTARPELLRTFESGHAWFSRLDGEWSLRFCRE